MEQNSQTLFIRCASHKTSNYQLISLQQGIQEKRFFCSECLFSQQEGNIKREFIDLIPLSIVVNQPQEFISWMKQESISSYLNLLVEFSQKNLNLEFDQEIKNIDDIIIKLQNFKIEAKEQLEKYINLQKQFKLLKDQFYKEIKYNEFCENLSALQKSEESDSSVELEKALTKILNEMLQENCAIIKQSYNQIKYQQNNLINDIQQQDYTTLNKEISKQLRNHKLFARNINEEALCATSQLFTNEYQKTIYQKIMQDKQTKIKKSNLIYLGSRDGLNGKAFWSKVDGRNNLLMIFKSKNNGNYIFGGYSPCQWQSNLGYVQDDTLTSFLFSQTHNQIYPLKQDCKQCAIWSGQGYGPTFGSGHDIYINSDFNQGYSKLGNSYQWDYKGETSNHLFGGAKPNIEECEIFQILFE